MIDRLKSFFRYSRTILLARLLTAAGFLVTAYDAIGQMLVGQDLTPLYDFVWKAPVLSRIPVEFHTTIVSLLVMGLGLFIEYLRTQTTKPLEVKEVEAQAAKEEAPK
jgi:hypothetical protein